jgi:hypothetical protein
MSILVMYVFGYNKTSNRTYIWETSGSQPCATMSPLDTHPAIFLSSIQGEDEWADGTLFYIDASAHYMSKQKLAIADFNLGWNPDLLHPS